MRQYRGKRVDNGKWVYGYYIKYRGDHFILLKKAKSFLGGFITVIPETVGQSTSFKDKNGKEIYEGNKLHYTKTGMGQKWIHEGTVEYGWHCASWNYDTHTEGEWYMGFYVQEGSGKMPLGWRSNPEIIGDIHNNPELCEVKK